MKLEPTDLPGVVVVRPDVFGDERGFFLETHRESRYREAGIAARFVQDNLSGSRRGVLRGLHLQHPKMQAKLVNALRGKVFDVAVDVRVGSPTFGRWTGVVLDDVEKRQLFIPEGFAHGFCVLSDEALFAYKCTADYDASCELAIRWDDPEIGIDWPLEDVQLSPRDATAPALREIDPALLPRHPGA